MSENTRVVIPWHNPKQRDMFREAWKLSDKEPWPLFIEDEHHDGCAVTKNRGIAQAMQEGADIVIVLDDDCYPSDTCPNMDALVNGHVEALSIPALIGLFKPVTSPASRGTPYFTRHVYMPPAASMGFWNHIPDYDAPSQLVRGATAEMYHDRNPVFGRYFPLCGMNLAFRPRQWMPWCQFINVPRFDDIWMGWLWQKEAYRRSCYFNLNGPVVTHSRQSNVWANLRDEAKWLEQNETIWQKVATSQADDYDTLRALLPV